MILRLLGRSLASRPAIPRTLPPLFGRQLCSTSKTQRPDELNSAGKTAVLLEKPLWSVRALLEPKSATSDAAAADQELLDRVLRLSGLNAEQRPEERVALSRDLAALRHFVQHVQDAKVPADVKPLVRLCEWDWAPEAAFPDPSTEIATQASDNSVTAAEEEEEEQGRALLRHAARLESSVYYTVPAPAAMAQQQQQQDADASLLNDASASQ
ncbi:hypothetical protein THASP1DRAFT_30049 [Thamnocephalis sphaerospora]|uniref:Uncharacterized protein n=1 Tax=Thamnocephalis sphaerospora TaxID=78915 RepID=A0A4P9XQG6_9FUNG|nr:hypothetical protein THASP1DRAFT_30049 [Thamnocephalis sphaerospora]|eukprot:RKP08152.1 hypothetical protein THASP1DRAFT_30049 [Thamnocephalis sphaerospora]